MDKGARQREDSGKQGKKKKKAVYYCYDSATIFLLF